MLEEVKQLGVTEAQYTQMGEFSKAWRQSDFWPEENCPLMINAFKEDFDDLVVVYAQVSEGDRIISARIIEPGGKIIDERLFMSRGSFHADGMIESLIHMYAANTSNFCTQGITEDWQADFMVY